MSCQAKHVWTPPDEQWKCPKCGSKDWVVDNTEYWECDGLHPDDELRCEKCGHEQTGRSFSNRVKKMLNMVQCPTCKGTGMVRKSTVMSRPVATVGDLIELLKSANPEELVQLCEFGHGKEPRYFEVASMFRSRGRCVVMLDETNYNGESDGKDDEETGD